MQILDMLAENMLPRVLLVRLYDTVAMKHTVKKRISDAYELSLYLDGNGTVSIQNEEYPACRGAIRFTKPGMLLSSIPDYRCITVFFDFGSANTLCRNPVLDGIPSYLATDCELQSGFEALLRAYVSTQPTAPLQQNARLLSLLAELYEKVHSGHKRNGAVHTCMRYMQKNFSENITLETLGELTGYSRLHLLRLFKQDLGQTPHEYLTAIRLEQAKKLLSETDMSLENVSLACGFRSMSHFKTLFKQLTHYTPGIYRKNTRQL